MPNVLAWYAARARDLSRLAFAEAWSWAEANGLLVHSISANHVGVFELSFSLVAGGGSEEFWQASASPRSLLHPLIAEQAWHLFSSGLYNVAVFAAFKAVEVAVANASGCPGTGTALMHAAFDKDAGPLRDPMLDKGERDAISHLFAGAFGTFRNPVGHRDVTFADAAEPDEQLIVARYFMRVVDAARLR